MPRSELRNRDFLRSSEAIALIIDHETVTPDNYDEHIVGAIANVQYRGGKVTALVRVYNRNLTNALFAMIEDDIEPEVSLAYKAKMEPKRGFYNSRDGSSTSYNYIQRDLKCNHLALVRHANMPEAKLQNDAYVKGGYMYYNSIPIHPAAVPPMGTFPHGYASPPYPAQYYAPPVQENPTQVQNEKMSKEMMNEISDMMDKKLKNFAKTLQGNKEEKMDKEDKVENTQPESDDPKDYANLLYNANKYLGVEFNPENLSSCKDIVTHVLLSNGKEEEYKDKEESHGRAYVDLLIDNARVEDARKKEKAHKERIGSFVSSSASNNNEPSKAFDPKQDLILVGGGK